MAGTECNEYKPTPAEERLLLVLANPENIGKTVTDLCNLAEISRKHYYEMFKKPDFVACQEKFAKDLIKQAVNPIITACIKEAKNGSFQHAKLLMEMGQMYTPKQIQENTGSITYEIKKPEFGK